MNSRATVVVSRPWAGEKYVTSNVSLPILSKSHDLNKSLKGTSYTTVNCEVGEPFDSSGDYSKQWRVIRNIKVGVLRKKLKGSSLARR